ncbi:hypothetical protein VMCG_05510 [Cytospora schulzeri]|uniref:Uncharacterized protein n=1 Tax=Cytospora schulzeri TaxID=448051 RepID=A0A423WER3_9PEZI|nr:hypothetical protein VMCG_05510 [Valsa malicola]
MTNRAETLESYFRSRSEEALRPILTSLNGDASWLVSIPLPSPSPRKTFYHIVLDPWLNGPATHGTSWVMCIDRLAPSAAHNGADVDGLIREIETAAAGFRNMGQELGDEKGQGLDAIFVNFHYLDHMHQPTLVTFDKNIPVFATPEAAGLLRNWGHFDTVVTTHDFKESEQLGSGWKAFHPGSPLPPWLSVFRIPGNKELNFATAIIWSHDAVKQDDGIVTKAPQKHEVLLNTPHGANVTAPAVQAFFDSTSRFNTQIGVDKIEVLALFAALKDSFTLGMRTTLGVAGGLAMERLAKPRYWVRSHDTVLGYSGVFMRLIGVNDVKRTLDDGLEEEARTQGKTNDEGDKRRPNLVDVANGECFVLG